MTRPAPLTARRRGRTAIMTRDTLLERIRQIAHGEDGLFRIHHRHPDLYARARRMFGSWGEAVRLAGVDYDDAVERARRRSRLTLREKAQLRRGHDPATTH